MDHRHMAAVAAGTAVITATAAEKRQEIISTAFVSYAIFSSAIVTSVQLLW